QRAHARSITTSRWRSETGPRSSRLPARKRSQIRGTRARVVKSVSGGTPGGMMPSNTFWSSEGEEPRPARREVAGPSPLTVCPNQVENKLHHRRVAAPATLGALGVVQENVLFASRVVEDVDERGPFHSEVLGDREGGRRLQIDRGASVVVPRLEIVAAL